MPSIRTQLAAAVVGNRLYAVGGISSDVTGAVEVYDPATDTWATKASLTTARRALGVSVLNGTLYAVGGLVPDYQPVATVEAYNPTLNSWTTKAPMPTSRWSPGVAALNGRLYAVGGSASVGPANSTGVVEVYQP